jgi:hypothetical protein
MMRKFAVAAAVLSLVVATIGPALGAAQTTPKPQGTKSQGNCNAQVQSSTTGNGGTTGGKKDYPGQRADEVAALKASDPCPVSA